MKADVGDARLGAAQKHGPSRWALAWGCAALAFATTAPSAAALELLTGADAICTRLSSQPHVSSEASQTLTQAALEAELRLRDGADEPAAPLDIEVPEQANTDARSLAAYCSAAGEIARTQPAGSSTQAVRLLSAAVATADAGAETELAALAAYRLGMAAINASPSTETRSTARAAQSNRRRSSTAGSPACTALNAAAARGAGVNPEVALACAADRAVQSQAPALAARAYLRLARLRLDMASVQPENAQMLRQRSADAALAGLAAARLTPDANERAMLLGRLAETALDAGAYDTETLSNAATAMRDAAPDDRALAAEAWALDARVFTLRSEFANAAAAMQNALFLESQRAAPLRLADWHMLLADIETRRGNQDAHDLQVEAAYRALQAVRPLMELRDPLTEESTFALRMRPIFEAKLELELRVGRRPDGGQHIGVAQLVLEAFRQAEMESVFGSECVPPRDAIIARDVAAVASERPDPRFLAHNEVVLYPVLLNDRVELIYASGRDGGGYRLAPPTNALGREAVAGLVQQMRVSLSLSGRGQDWRGAAKQLYDTLIRPIEDQFSASCHNDAATCTTLIIVPDGPLRALPFAALIDNSDGSERYLVERTRLGVAPALAYAQAGRASDGAAASVVSAWVNDRVILPAGDFARLDAAPAEATAAVGAAADAVSSDRCRPVGALLCNFTARDLSETLAGRQVDILHLATHASFEGRSDRTFIVASDGVISLAALRAMIEHNRAQGDDLDLLVLSACETALGDDQASMGLAGAAVQAGARSAMASLWRVNDSSTGELMGHFYQRYRGADVAKAEAVRGAQLDMIASERYAHPHHWAAFMLIGAWR